MFPLALCGIRGRLVAEMSEIQKIIGRNIVRARVIGGRGESGHAGAEGGNRRGQRG